MRICDLRQKEVINIKDCKRLGYVCDIEFDRKTCGLFGRDTEYRIPFCRVCQIGPDIILVDIDEGEKPIRDKEK